MVSIARTQRAIISTHLQLACDFTAGGPRASTGSRRQVQNMLAAGNGSRWYRGYRQRCRCGCGRGFGGGPSLPKVVRQILSYHAADQVADLLWVGAHHLANLLSMIVHDQVGQRRHLHLRDRKVILLHIHASHSLVA